MMMMMMSQGRHTEGHISDARSYKIKILSRIYRVQNRSDPESLQAIRKFLVFAVKFAYKLSAPSFHCIAS
jgi:hypothetical protein